MCAYVMCINDQRCTCWHSTTVEIATIMLVSREYAGNVCDKCNKPVNQGGCACDKNCNCITVNKCDKCNKPLNQGGCACDKNCDCVTVNKCDKCNKPTNQGGCACDKNCDCVAVNKCDKCNRPASQGGCKCNNNCDCIGAEPIALLEVLTYKLGPNL
jgi:hypothetical protein